MNAYFSPSFSFSSYRKFTLSVIYIILWVVETGCLALNLAFCTGPLHFGGDLFPKYVKSSLPFNLCFSYFLLSQAQCFAYSRRTLNIWGSLNRWMNASVKESTKKGIMNGCTWSLEAERKDHHRPPCCFCMFDIWICDHICICICWRAFAGRIGTTG